MECLSREVVESTSLGVSQERVDVALGAMICWHALGSEVVLDDLSFFYITDFVIQTL